MNGFCCHFQKSEKKVTHPQKKIRISKHPTSKFWLPFACTQRLCSVLQISHAFAFKHTLAHNHTGCVALEPTRSGRRVQPWPPAVCSAGDQQVATRLCRGESAASLCSARMLATHESLEVDLLHGACSRLRPRLLRPRDCGRRRDSRHRGAVASSAAADQLRAADSHLQHAGSGSRVCMRMHRQQPLRRQHHAVRVQQLASDIRMDALAGCCKRLQLASTRDQLRRCGKRRRTAKPVHMHCEWCRAAARATLLTAWLKVGWAFGAEAFVQKCSAAQPRGAKNFLLTAAQAVRFLASTATVRGH